MRGAAAPWYTRVLNFPLPSIAATHLRLGSHSFAMKLVLTQSGVLSEPRTTTKTC